MDSLTENSALKLRETELEVVLRSAVSLWAAATTGESERRADLLRDKLRSEPTD